jgi:hypothetical protein
VSKSLVYIGNASLHGEKQVGPSGTPSDVYSRDAGSESFLGYQDILAKIFVVFSVSHGRCCDNPSN